MQINASYKPAYIYGGPTMSVSRLSEELVKAGVQVDVFTTTANGRQELVVVKNRPIVVDGVRVTYFTRITKDHSHFSPQLLWNLWKHVKEYDVVHIHAWWNLVSVLSALVAQLRKVPVLISPRGTLSAYTFKNKKSIIKKKIHKLLGDTLLSRSYIHVTSGAEYRELSSLIKPVDIFDLPNFVQLPVINDDAMPAPGAVFKLLFLSRVEQKKGLDILIKALPLVKYPCRLTIAGDGDKNYMEELKDMTRSGGVEDMVHWAGFQGKNKFKLLQGHQLLVLPSHDENFGNVVIESLGMGTAVLISEYVGLADYVKMNDLGWLCATEAGSVAEKINEIVSLKQDELLRIRREAPAKIARDFDEGELVQKYIAQYNQIIDHGRI